VKIARSSAKANPTLAGDDVLNDPVWVYFSVESARGFRVAISCREEKKTREGWHDPIRRRFQIILENRELYPFDGKFNALIAQRSMPARNATISAEFPNPGNT